MAQMITKEGIATDTRGRESINKSKSRFAVFHLHQQKKKSHVNKTAGSVNYVLEVLLILNIYHLYYSLSILLGNDW